MSEQMDIKLEEAMELVKYLKAEESDDTEELEVNWLESTDEWVVNLENTVIMDGLTEVEANRYQDILQGYRESLNTCTFCKRTEAMPTRQVGGYTILECCTDCEEEIGK